jgi:hypothetical protein
VRIRLREAIKVRRSLPNGSAVHHYPKGDYEVGPEIPSDIAENALRTKQAIRLPVKGERETKTKKRSKQVA